MINTSADALLDAFAIRSFRDIADGDYIGARMALRADLTGQHLWGSQQAIEKYFKCTLLLNRIEAKEIGHSLKAGIEKITASRKLKLDLSPATKDFIEYIDRFRQFRYFEYSYYFASNIVDLDRAVLELRRYCARPWEFQSSDGSKVVPEWKNGSPAPKVRLFDGRLEKIIKDPKHPARKALLWKNAFFSNRLVRKLQVRTSFMAANSPLALSPEILDEVERYVKISQRGSRSFIDSLSLHPPVKTASLTLTNPPTS